MTLENIMSELIRLETEDLTHSPSMESWEDISVNTLLMMGPNRTP